MQKGRDLNYRRFSNYFVLFFLYSASLASRQALASALAFASEALASAIRFSIFNRTKLTIHLRRFIRPVLTIGVSSVVGLGACMLWMKSGIIANSILLFITSAMIHFGVYVVLVVISRDDMALEVLQMGTELLRRKS